MTEDLDAVLDRLYGLPAGEFTAARDALAKELRAAKRRDEAAEVKALRRPTAPAAAVNQLAREQPALMDALLDAAAALREVQERLLAGEAGRDELRAAADAERRAVGDLVAAAGRLPDAPSPPALEKVRATLHAAATDDEVRDAIARGRLAREAESAGAWGGLPLSLGAMAPSEAPAPRSSRAAARDAAADREAQTPGGEAASAARDAASSAAADRAVAAGRDAVTAADRDEAASAVRDADTSADREAQAPPARPSAADRARERRAAKRAAELERLRAAAAAAEADLAAAQRAAGDAHQELEAAAERAEEARAVLATAERAEESARAAAQKTLRTLKRAEALAADAAEQVARLERDA